eukprot:scaffold3464_cov406-Prasinococcus_capsulatus_cf.AAC.3
MDPSSGSTPAGRPKVAEQRRSRGQHGTHAFLSAEEESKIICRRGLVAAKLCQKVCRDYTCDAAKCAQVDGEPQRSATDLAALLAFDELSSDAILSMLGTQPVDKATTQTQVGSHKAEQPGAYALSLYEV